MILPQRLFFTGVPGSKWSSISQDLENTNLFNTSDHSASREFNSGIYTGHKGAYFGKGMEFEPVLDYEYIDSVWEQGEGIRIVKSHDWAYKFDDIKLKFPNDWIMLIYRPDIESYAWWHEAGGFKGITYPSYAEYKNSKTMLTRIMEQNAAILHFAHRQRVVWESFTPEWIEKEFGVSNHNLPDRPDILVTIVK